MKYKISRQVGRKIRSVRKRQKMSQEKLAELANLHVSSLGRIERGEANPPLYTIFRLSKGLKVKLKDLMS